MASWLQVKELVQSALERPPELRAAFVSQVCDADDDLRREVESLLAAHQRAGTFLDAQPPSSSRTDGSDSINGGVTGWELSNGDEMLEDATRLRATRPMGALVGQHLGHYEVLAALGAGGMGEVYLARDTRLGRMVALKIVAPYAAAGLGAHARLLSEARHASSLNHPSICTVHEVGETAEHVFIVMEYVAGQTLSAMIRPEGLPLGAVVRYGVQVADALEHAHQHGVVHRDLKSANIMVTPAERIKVLDFGLARGLKSPVDHGANQSHDPVTARGFIIGTLAFMAPERLRGKPADERVDIWALGVLLY